jgi:hypothetical protein
MWHEREIARALEGSDVEQSEHIRSNHGGASLSLESLEALFALDPDYRRVGPAYDVMLGKAAFDRLQPHPGQA